MTSPHFRRQQRAMLRKVAAFLLAFVASLAAAADQAPLPSQSVESSEARTTPDTRTGSPGAASPRPQPVAMPGSPDSNATAEVENLRRFNELRREILDYRAKTVDWWLEATAIFLTLLGIVAAIAVYLSFKRLRDFETQARRYVDRIEALHDKAESRFKGFTAQFVQENPDKARRATENAQENPPESPIDQAVAAAVQLQQLELFEESIEKWHAIAIISEGTDKDLAARAWFSIGYLRQKHNIGTLGAAIDAYDKAIRRKSDLTEAYNNRGNAKDNLGHREDAIADLDEAIRLKPDYTEAYYNRGNVKGNLGRHEEAIADYGEAVKLKPDFAIVYNNRGNAKGNLGRHEEAIADYDEAIRLKPGYAKAYNNRGKANLSLSRVDEARRDFETAITLARDAGDETLASDAESALKELLGGQAP